MASKYIQKFPIPGAFPDLLHDFAREVLRDQPDDIYAYGGALKLRRRVRCSAYSPPRRTKNHASVTAAKKTKKGRWRRANSVSGPT